MRKFLRFFVVLFIMAGIALITWDNMDKWFHGANVVSAVKNGHLYYENEKIYLNGINLDSVKPGQLPGELKGSQKQYENWIKQIHKLGVNCIKVKSIMPRTFYDALLDYNKQHKQKMYLIQGVSITADELSTNESGQMNQKDLSTTIKKDIKLAVNVVHGNQTPFFSKKIDHFYMSDVSEYTVAYSIDSALDYSDVIFSEIMDNNSSNNGYYVRAKANASATEKTFAEIANALVTYEARHYHSQRMLTIQANRADVIQAKLLRQQNRKETGKKRYINVRNIYATKYFRSGMFDSYSLNLENNESLIYKEIKTQLDLLRRSDGKTPLVVTEYAVPTSRAGDNYRDNQSGGINEQEQAECLIKIDQQIKKAHCAGAFILEWQDAWYRNTWNVSKLVKNKTSAKWDNIMSYSEHFGLLDFDPSTIFPDGEIDDWKGIEALSTHNGTQLSVSYDNAYLQIKVISKKDLTKQPIILDFNVTPVSGSKQWQDYQFEQPADFVVKIAQNQGEMFVQDYYDANQFLANQQKIKRSSNYHKNRHSTLFNKIELPVQNRYYSILKEQFVPEKDTNIGQLVEGNANPDADDYDSLTNYHLSKHVLELRIPWQLLNFYDPSNCEIIGDMYKNMAIMKQSVDHISLGVSIGNGNETVRLKDHAYSLPKWKKPTYHSRLKKSYYRLQEYFKKEAGTDAS